MKKDMSYKRYLKEKKITKKYDVENENTVIEKQSNFLKLLYFLYVIITKIIKILIYIGLIALCSLGATYLINNILKIKIIGGI